jgi:Chaperone of endosialidase
MQPQKQKAKTMRTLHLQITKPKPKQKNKTMKTIFSVLLLGLTSLLALAPYSATAQVFNEALGTGALQSNSTGDYDVALGDNALFSNTTGSYNTATGFQALRVNAAGLYNTASGAQALFRNTGSSNTASGVNALYSNTTGNENTVSGVNTLFYNTTGYANTASGVRALYQNTTGYYNTASGFRSLFSNRTGNYNTASGVNALWANINGDGNTASGYAALYSNNGDHNTAFGTGALSYSSGTANTALGNNAGTGVTIASNVICIGAGIPGSNVNNSCYIGNIWNQPGGSQPIYINSEGKLGFYGSSQRFKDEIKPVEQASEVIYSLKPVSFRYKPEIEPTRPLGFGLIAEDVEKVSLDLVTRGGDGKANSVRYDAVNAMLLNEFLKEHRKNEQREATINQLKSAVVNQEATIAQQQKDFQSAVAQQQKETKTLVARLDEQASQIRKVSAQLKASRPAPQVVSNP